jgi:hypothetical protein
MTGLVIGIAIGAAITLVLTPRPALAPGADPTDTGDGAARPVSGDPLAAVVERVRERYEEAKIQGREAYERARSEVLQIYNQARAQQ